VGPTVLEGKAARDGLRRSVLPFFAAAVVCMLAVGAAAAGTAASSHARRVIATPATLPLRTGLLDPSFAGSDRQQAFTMAAAAGATYVRLSVDWRSLAPATQPAGFQAADPSSPGYRWTGLDSVLAHADAAGLTPILDISTVPGWAYATQPKSPNAGTPRTSDLGDFAKALATHYDGTIPGVPAEHVFQVWNEPNLSLDLNPVSASAYRSLVNAVADAVHGVDPANLVVAGGLDPFGHRKKKGQKWYSTAPLAYMRSLLCLSKGKHPHATCRNPIKFDVWSHHPYTFGGPFGHAKNPDDVELGDLPKMRALLKAGKRFHHIVSARPTQFWVTEFGWDTSPPRRHAASLNLASRWTAESLHQMWLSNISLVTWFLLQDYPGRSPYQSGLYFNHGALAGARAKPVLTAFRFPFVAYLGKKKTVTVWGRDATSTKQLVTVQRSHHRGGPWSTVATVRSNASGIFKATLRLKATKKDWLRATAPDSGRSLAFSLTVPHAPHVGPWGN
jgi:Cellulase (glycosyl hydrolase family 5)